MDVVAQMLLTMLVIGSVVGAAARLTTRSGSLIAYVIAGITGAIVLVVGAVTLAFDRVYALAGGDEFVFTISASLIGAVAFCGLARALSGPARRRRRVDREQRR